MKIPPLYNHQWASAAAANSNYLPLSQMRDGSTGIVIISPFPVFNTAAADHHAVAALACSLPHNSRLGVATVSVSSASNEI